MNKMEMFERVIVGKDVTGIVPMTGVSKAPPGEHFFLEESYATLEIENDDDRGEKIRSIMDCIAPVWVADGRDLIHLTSKASGELTTLFMNTTVNIAMQNIAMKFLNTAKLGSKLKVLNRYTVGDDSEWKFSYISEGITKEDVQTFSDWLNSIYERMGHEFSSFKFFMCPASAEFVQTYARFGLYLPKDQIMIIGSEKPCRILDPRNFLMSLKRVLLTKVSRGFNDAYAYLIILLHYRYLMSIDIRRRKITLGPEYFPSIKGWEGSTIVAREAIVDRRL